MAFGPVPEEHTAATHVHVARLGANRDDRRYGSG